MENLFDGCCDFTEVGHQHQTQEGQVFGRGAPQAHEGLRKLSVSRPHPQKKIPTPKTMYWTNTAQT